MTIQQLLGHSTRTVTICYTHTNLDSKSAAVAKLETSCDVLLTSAPKRSNEKAKVSQMAPLKLLRLIELKTEECVSGRNGRS